MLEGLDNGHVRVLEGDVLADEDDLDRVDQAVVAGSQLPPSPAQIPAKVLLWLQAETALEKVDHALLLKEKRDVISGFDVVHAENLVVSYVAEHGELADDGWFEALRTSCGNHVWYKTETSEILDGSLSRLCLLLASDDRYETDVDKSKVVLTDSELKLSECLYKGSRLNVSNCSAELDDADLWRETCRVDWLSCYAKKPILNGICEVWYDLDSLSEVVTATFLFNDFGVNFASGDVVITTESDVEVSLVVAQVEICFTAIVENIDFSVFCGCHCSCINVHVWINFDCSDSKTERFEKEAGG